MNKTSFIWLLQSTLLLFEGISEESLKEVYGINPYVIEASKDLLIYIKTKEMFQNETHIN